MRLEQVLKHKNINGEPYTCDIEKWFGMELSLEKLRKLRKLLKQGGNMKKLVLIIGLIIGLGFGQVCYARTTTQEYRATGGDFGAVSVTTAATQICIQQNERSNIIIQNRDSASIFIGWENTVTTVNGLEILPNATLTITDCNLSIWGICASDTADVRFLREID